MRALSRTQKLVPMGHMWVLEARLMVSSWDSPSVSVKGTVSTLKSKVPLRSSRLNMGVNEVEALRASRSFWFRNGWPDKNKLPL